MIDQPPVPFSDPRVQDWDALIYDTAAPQLIADLVDTRLQVSRLRTFGRSEKDIQEKCWEVQQLLDKVEMWVDALREEYPSGAQDPE